LGNLTGDILPFIIQYQASYGGNEIDEFRVARCVCESEAFFFSYNEGGAARRYCPECDAEHLICDSEDYYDPAKAIYWDCRECRHPRCNLGVGFALSSDREFIRWLYIGQRCARCGLLDFCVSWKIMYGPSLQLMDQV
jgi:hypothetical protein